MLSGKYPFPPWIMSMSSFPKEILQGGEYKLETYFILSLQSYKEEGFWVPLKVALTDLDVAALREPLYPEQGFYANLLEGPE